MQTDPAVEQNKKCDNVMINSLTQLSNITNSVWTGRASRRMDEVRLS